MKAVKFLVAFWVVIFLSSLITINSFGQETDNVKQTKKVEKKGDSQKGVEKEKVEKKENSQNEIEKVKVGENLASDDDVVSASDDVVIEKTIYAKRDDDRYRIGFQDILDIKVYRHPELNQTVSVNPDGTINLFRIDNPVVAVCKTEKQLQDLVAQLYTNFLKNPFVNVRAIEQRSQPFAVIGAVEKPGSFYLNKKVRLIQLLSLAGGYDVEKAGSKIQIARIGNLAGCEERDGGQTLTSDVEFLSYNLFEVLKGKQNPWVQPGDIVSVLEAEEAYVVGNVVNEAEKISLKEPVTLMQAIAMAGGLDKNAKTSQVKIQRQKPGTPIRTEMVFNLKDILAQKIPDPVLQANDIVEVPTDKMKSARNKLIEVFTGGLGNIFYRFPL